MKGPAITPLYIDSDNALGSSRGDVDDGFAIAALFASGVEIAGLASVFGNTTEPLAHANHKALASLCGYKGPLLRGASAPRSATGDFPGPAHPGEPSGSACGERARSISEQGQAAGAGSASHDGTSSGGALRTGLATDPGTGSAASLRPVSAADLRPGLATDPRTGSGASGLTEAARVQTEASRFLLALREPVRVLALGPLTNLAAALDAGLDAPSRWTEVVAVGGNISSHGRWPPVWPFEFNITKDRQAALAVFASRVRLTLVPLDVARRLSVARSDIDAIPGLLGAHLRAGSARWQKRAARLKLARSFPVWDLAAALYALDAGLFETRAIAATLHTNGWIEFGSGALMVQCVERFDRDRLWQRFLGLAANIPLEDT